MEYGLRFLAFLQLLLDYLVRPIYWAIERSGSKRIPQNEDPLLRQSAVKLAKKIRNKEIRSEDLVCAYIQRIREVNPILNAVVEDRYNAALADAKAVDECIKLGNRTPEELEREVPLFGVPMTVKESCGLAGMSYCVGSISRVGVKSKNDGDAVSLLRAAGAIPLAVTNTPELCLSWESINLVTGRTVNPYNTYRTSGGSSGGEGALIGAGASLMGIGSDIAGSIRVPSAFNGIFGHKPTGGVVSIEGHYPQSTDAKFPEYLVLGPMTRYAEDLTLMLKIVAGKNSSKLNLDSKVDLNKLTVYFMEDASTFGDVPVDKDIKKAIIKGANHLSQNCGSKISNIKFAELKESIEMSISVFFTDLQDIPNILQDPNNPKKTNSLLLETMKSLIGCSQHSLNALLFYVLKETNVFIPRSRNPIYQRKFHAFQKKLEETLKTDGVLLYPSFPSVAFNHYGLFTKTAGVMYTMLFNLMGFPSTHVPVGLDNNGLPVGFQVIATRNQDRLCLAVAKELENAFGGWIPPPSIAN